MILLIQFSFRQVKLRPSKDHFSLRKSQYHSVQPQEMRRSSCSSVLLNTCACEQQERNKSEYMERSKAGKKKKFGRLKCSSGQPLFSLVVQVYQCLSIFTFSLRIHIVHLELHCQKKDRSVWLYRRCGTQARVYSQTLWHGNSKKEIRQKKQHKKSRRLT